MNLFFKKEDIKKKNKLKNILGMAQNLIERSDIKNVREAPVYSLIRSMDLYDIVRELYEGEDVTYVQSIYDDIDGKYLKMFGNIKYCELEKRDVCIDLSKDAIIVCAWNKERFVNCLAGIGKNVGNEFRYQKNNHMARYMYPLGLTVVYNGNHSILSGVLKGKGVIQATETYDLKLTYDYIYFDGVYFRKKIDNKKIHKVKRFELGALYEIGRLLVENGIE